MATDTRRRDYTRESASWIIVDTFTGRAICETWNAQLLPLLNVARYRAVPILEYLGQLNARIRTTGSDQPNWIA